MKRIFKSYLSMLLAIVLIFSVVPVSASADSIAGIKRYTVLVLDASGSMSGQPARVQRSAAEKFSRSVLLAEGENYLALVELTYHSYVKHKFTSDINELLPSIQSFPENGNWTGTYKALEDAKSLLDQIPDGDNVIKNIVVCSDGLPNEGPTSYNGLFTSSDYSEYGYANAVCNLADEIKKSGTKIYGLGFFHNLSGSTLSFAEKFMKAISSENCSYLITDAEDLEFVFGEQVADDVIDNTEKEDIDPIIVIPGVMGSRLFTSSSDFSEKNRAWDPPINYTGITQLNDRLDPSVTLYVRPCENQNIDLSEKDDSTSVDDYGREYGAQNAYEKIVNRLCDEYSYQNPEHYRPVYVFSYDWRKSNKISADKLNTEIQKILKEHEATKVDLVCHSMGGLVASSYYDQFSSKDQVDKIITCGTPYEGAPKLINAMENWDVLGVGAAPDMSFFDKDGNFKFDPGANTSDWVLAVFGGMTKALKTKFDGVCELTPTENYIDKCPMQKDSLFPFNFGDYNLSYDEYVKHCKRIFTDARYTSAVEFQESLHDSTGFNKLLAYPNAYFSLGINHPTICAVKFQFSNDDIDELLYESDLDYTTKGDGTVPYLSASIINKVEEISEKGVRWNTFDADHGETINSDKPMEWILDILSKGHSDQEGDAENGKKHVVVRIACPVDVTIKNGSEILSSTSDDYSIISKFGRLDFVGPDDDIKIACLYNDIASDVILTGNDTGSMTYSIRYYDENDELYDERIFENVPLTDQTIITTTTAEDDTTILQIDHDGDGTVDESIKASANEKVNAAPEIKKNEILIDNDNVILSAASKAQHYQIQASATSGRITYKSDNSHISVSNKGKVTVSAKYKGTAKITLSAEGEGYESVSKEITFTVES